MPSCKNISVVPGCFNGIPVAIHFTDDGMGAPATRIVDAEGVIVAGANATNTTPGACLAQISSRPLVADGINLASGTQVPVFTPSGSVTTWNHASGGKLQSVTVTVLRAGTPASGDTVQVKFGTSGNALLLTEGQDKTWSVAQDNGLVDEVLNSDITIECLGNSAATVAWTEHF